MAETEVGGVWIFAAITSGFIGIALGIARLQRSAYQGTFGENVVRVETSHRGEVLLVNGLIVDQSRALGGARELTRAPRTLKGMGFTCDKRVVVVEADLVPGWLHQVPRAVRAGGVELEITKVA